MYQKSFGYVGSTTYTQWYKMERPGVVLEDGHVTHVTWTVADVGAGRSAGQSGSTGMPGASGGTGHAGVAGHAETGGGGGDDAGSGATDASGCACGVSGESPSRFGAMALLCGLVLLTSRRRAGSRARAARQ
jgi:hypothetical protein